LFACGCAHAKAERGILQVRLHACDLLTNAQHARATCGLAEFCGTAHTC
jgi:hypothetical protein